MSEILRQLVTRIRGELVELEVVLLRVEEGWSRAKYSADDYYLDGVALNLHGFYSGLEHIFELIATQALLCQMTQEVSGVRPTVISESIYNQLDVYRGFHHVVRNVYTFKFDPVKIESLVEKAPQLFSQIRTELLAFTEFLEQA